MKKLMLFFVGLLAALPLLAAPTVTLSSHSITGASPLTQTVSWTSTGAATCTLNASPARGDWAGVVGPSGSQQISGVTAQTTLTIDCTAPFDPVAHFTWTTPTLNNDGTSLTDRTGYRLYQKVSSGSNVLIATPGPTQNTQNVGPFVPGTYAFVISTTSTSGCTQTNLTCEGDPSNVATWTLATPETATDSAVVTPSKKAMPPTLTVQ